MLAIILSRSGYQVNVFESRLYSRKHHIYQEKSINLALSDRAWLALDKIGISDQIRKYAGPLYERIIHALDGSIKEQNYGYEKQARWSVSRAQLNEQLIALQNKRNMLSFILNID